MKWVVAAFTALQLPFLFIIFVMAGTDGKRESLISVWLVVIPVGLCAIATVVNAFIRSEWREFEWSIAAVACAPALFILVRSILR
ncbi:MAG TPA: hypothetical protein VMF90_17530 [Rhizobiaceae bacterium]|nr:hypothetical protein [Rhizobiaceae bacterium]